ncbi:MAG: IS3 family transposase [Ignavibacteriales bacterium]|nr:IS3 family transposase [Ignavibacteriales bacterium]
MLSGVLNSKRAIRVNIEIMRAFVKLRELLSTHKDLTRKLHELEKKYDAQFRIVFEAIRELMALRKKPGKEISRTGNCYENAVTESFFHTFKIEHVFFSRFETRQKTRTSVFDYIELFYNRQRIHSTINNLSPMQYEQQLNLS